VDIDKVEVLVFFLAYAVFAHSFKLHAVMALNCMFFEVIFAALMRLQVRQ
jgi:hypothetical protein